jgi:hypothetical protein
MGLCCLQEMDGTKNHCVKWNKPDWERQTSHVLSYMQNLDLKKRERMTQM